MQLVLKLVAKTHFDIILATYFFDDTKTSLT